MRILALVTDGFGVNGGIARYNCDLMMALSSSTHVEEVLALPRFGVANDQCPAGVVQCESIPNAYRWATKAVSLGLRRRIDAIFCGHLNAATFAARLARASGKPLWVQAHGIEAWEDRGANFRWALASARLITSVSRHTRRKLLSWCDIDPNRVRVLPNTFNSSRTPATLRPDLVARYGLEGCKVILTVGRMSSSERYKGHDRVIRCLPSLACENQPVKYLIVGTGDDRPRLEELARELGVRDSTVFAGYVPANKLADHYALADVFAMPSTGEGFGIVFLEAAASGLSVIGGNSDGSVDALADGAIGTPLYPDDLPALASALASALKQRERCPSPAVDRFAFQNFELQVHQLVQRFNR